jgi:hypothetical protein
MYTEMKLGDLGVDGRIILRRVLKEIEGKYLGQLGKPTVFR